MATLHPFKAVRPLADKAAEIASVPYDVISVAEARELAKDNLLSFLHVIRPEIDLDAGIDEHADSVYAMGAANLKRFVESDNTVQESEPSLYVYRQIMDGRHQTGIFSCVAVAEYDDDTILKHEKTRPVKEDDRSRHILEQSAHAEPVMLTFKDEPSVGAIIENTKSGTSLYDFTATDGVQHTVWRVADPAALVVAFQNVQNLYVADGHHRCKAASRTVEAIRPSDPAAEVNFFPAVVFPMSDMVILPYNRVIKKLPVSVSDFTSMLKRSLKLEPTTNPVPSNRGDICIYIDNAWFKVTLPKSVNSDVVSDLDVARLGEHILAPMLNITDPRRDPNIDFVGGIRGTAELERIVGNGSAEMAISMYPTSIQQLVDVSDAGQLMPPKSTWFEPKLRSGLLVHLF